jgi:predicted ribosomally synthesized peptide with nif11-like leader
MTQEVRMSKQSAQAFLDLMKSDEDLAQKMAAAKSEEEAVAVIEAAGDYDFNKEEWLAVVQEVADQELSEEDLDKVAGGHWYSGFEPDDGKYGA